MKDKCILIVNISCTAAVNTNYW